MAGTLNTRYVVLIALTVLAGLGIVLQRVNDNDRGGSRWLELSSIAIAFLFVLVLVGEMLV
jgi:hypothetical protein